TDPSSLPPMAEPPSTRIGFTGHEIEDDLGLINMKGRLYDPRMARFLTPDPFVTAPRLGTGYDRYAYVRNNPLRLRDPNGFSAACPAGYMEIENQCVMAGEPVEVKAEWHGLTGQGGAGGDWYGPKFDVVPEREVQGRTNGNEKSSVYTHSVTLNFGVGV